MFHYTTFEQNYDSGFCTEIRYIFQGFLHNNVSYTERLHQSATTLKQLTGKVDHIDPLVTIPWVLAVIWTPLDTQHHYTKADLECDENSRCQVNPGPTEGPPWTGPDSDTSRH